MLGLVALIAGCDMRLTDPNFISGDSPQDISIQIEHMENRLEGKKRAEFAHAVTTLTLVVPDKADSRTIGYMSPQFARMVKGRDADQIIQLAALYRASVPMDRP